MSLLGNKAGAGCLNLIFLTYSQVSLYNFSEGFLSDVPLQQEMKYFCLKNLLEFNIQENRSLFSRFIKPHLRLLLF